MPDEVEVIHHALWVPSGEGVGLEHLHLTERSFNVTADSLVIGVHKGEPYRLRYRVACDTEWQTRYVHLALLLVEEEDWSLALSGDGRGHWQDGRGHRLVEFDGCIDIDITSTPFTNTLPIRRLRLRPGQSSDLSMLYVNVPEMKIERSHQRYTCLRSDATGGVYRFQTLDYDFTADLTVDETGLVVDYPGLFRRITLSR